MEEQQLEFFAIEMSGEVEDKLFYEKQAWKRRFKSVAGVDEAGRGPLAGPVVAAACILPPLLNIEGINDSKQLSPQKRESLFAQLCADSRVIYGIGIVDAEVIDRINILQATIQAMHHAVKALSLSPDLLLVDGLQLPYPDIPCRKIIKGDELSLSIAAASILAKVTRDRLMVEFHHKWPHYRFDEHKGYGTPRHITALLEHGPSPIHRKSFEPVKSL
jgi:ribonuclease HII